MFGFGKKKEVGHNSRQLKTQMISASLNKVSEIKRAVADRLGAIYSEIDKLQHETKKAYKGLDSIGKSRFSTCSWHFGRAKYHVSRIIGKYR